MASLILHIRRWWRRVAVFMLVIAAAALWFLLGNFIVLWPVARAVGAQTAAIDEAELSAHVHFLAQPALKGRLPLSMGSRIARRHITDQFTACKLKPWGDAPEFNQPFNLGTNVVGFLPGSDSALADEYVLLTAHYDHLGFGHLGACDDASGVAALLEIAEVLSNANPRPRRSVAFAAFDCEEAGLIGGYAFSLRDDVQRAHIRAVINMDMLGRSFLDLLDNAVIVAGTEFYPETRQAVLAEGDTQGIRVYPAGLDLAGARGDHVAFLNLPRTGEASTLEPPAVLFFTNGTFEDYHEKGDRAERLDYALLTRSTRVIERTARRLADADTVESRTPCAVPDPAELDVFRAVGAEVLRQDKKLALTEEQRASAQSWLSQAEACSANPGYCTKDREDLIQKLATLGPSVNSLLAKAIGGGSDHLKDGDLRQIAGTGEMWRRYGAVFDEGYRGFVEKLLQRNVVSLALRGMPEPYIFQIPRLSDSDITVEDLGDGRLRLSMVYPTPDVWVNLYSFGRASFAMSVEGNLVVLEGTRDDLVDHCLLFWMSKRPTAADSQWWLDHMSPDADEAEREANRRYLEREKAPRWIAAVDENCRLLLEKVAGEERGPSLDAYLDRRVKQKGFPNREAWLVGLLEHENHRKVFSAAKLLHRRYPTRYDAAIRTAYLRFLEDPQCPADIRAAALHQLATSDSKESLRCIVPYTDDNTVVLPSPDPVEDEANPIRKHPVVRYGRDIDYGTEGSSPLNSHSSITLSEVALYELEQSTGQDLGTNASAWNEWLESDSVVLKDACGCHFSHPALRKSHFYLWQSVQ